MLKNYAILPEVSKLGHVSLVTENLEKSLWFFKDIVGLEETKVENGTHYLRAWGDFEHHTLAITGGNTSYVDHIAWKTKRPEDVEEFANMLTEDGVDVQWVENLEAGQGKAIRFKLPTGHNFELYFEMEKPEVAQSHKSVLKNQSHKSWAKGISPRRIDHVNLATTMDNKEITDYLNEKLGFKTREYVVTPDDKPKASWLSVTNLVHDLAVMTFDNIDTSHELHHMAYWLETPQDLLRAADILCEHELEFIGPGKHGVSQAMFIYVRDPGSGIRVELFAGGYLIFEPDWEPVKWTNEEFRKNGSTYWGVKERGDGRNLTIRA
ncbi:MAG TPA: VOC family protein [Ureibacillus sp.]|nr:VOC family protein [Ureibacillus sp.]